MSTPDDGTDRDDGARDLVAAYALDAVDDIERRAVERLVQRDPEVARELAELRATAAALGAACAAAPPPALRGAVLTAVRETSQLGSAADEARAPSPTGHARDAAHADRDGRARRRRPATTWLAVAAAVVGAAVVPSVLAVREAERSERLEQEVLAVTDLIADPAARIVRADVEGGGTAVGVLADDRAAFTGVDLPDPGTERDLQLWVVRDGAPRSVGVLDVERGYARALTDDFRPGDVLAVTVEPQGGSEQPTTEPVVVLATEA